MCCRVRVEPLVPDVATAILETGLFQHNDSGVWTRRVDEEGTVVSVNVRPHEHALVINLNPVVGNWDHHAGKRNAAGIMFEIAARYAEKVNGTVYQTGINVPECKEDSPGTHHLATYPVTRLDFEKVCAGFQRVFLGEEYV